jgi:hypothetical protein
MANTNFQPQGVTVPGGYAQPSPGITEQIETPADPSGNAYATELASGGTAILETGLYRDSAVTVQAAGTQTGPTAATVIATITPGTAGIWEITADVSITGTSVVAVESNNVALYQTSTAKINPVPMPATTAGVNPPVPIGPLTLNLSGADTVNIKALANATGTAIYAASIIARRVG